MTISIIACVTNYKNKLAIGRNNDLLFKLKNDINFFKNVTSNQLSSESKLDKNIVLMGRKTYFSLPNKYKPLKNRINLVLTNDKLLIKMNPVPKNLELNNELYYLDLKTFYKIYAKYNPNVFVIGGSEIYNIFIKTPECKMLYITHVQTSELKDIKYEENCPNVFMNHPTSNYELIGYSERFYEKFNENDLSYRILYYNKRNCVSEEYKYFDLMKNILNNGNDRIDRTNTGTVSLFGNQIKFDISNSIPLMTTKNVPFRIIVEELLWMCRGDSDAKILQKKGIKIWDGNTSREFLDKRGLTHYPEGVLGPQYGFLWRHFGATYSSKYADTSKIDTSVIGGFDQLKYIEYLIQNDPFSRRMMISAWSPDKLDEQCLPSCHTGIQFYVTEENNQKHLSCMFNMRSNDVFLANVFNVVFYSVLTYILAKKYDMKPKEIIYTCGDSHIYKNHINQVHEQLKRVPRPFPKLKLDDSIKQKEWNEITIDDFELVGYFPYNAIKASMAI